MEGLEIRQQIAQTGRQLLRDGLVARTWGNVSASAETGGFYVSPSGLDYLKTEPEDIVLCSDDGKSWQGRRKPSSERGIHAAAYSLFSEVGFVIHTHQSCASALGLAGFDTLDISAEELARLGGLACAKYGLPGTKKLKNAVAAAMGSGAKCVLMQKHGALICGRDREDALEKARLLEEICRRSLKIAAPAADAVNGEALLDTVRRSYPNAELTASDAAVAWSMLGLKLRAQLDDMAQMIGSSINCVPCDDTAVLAELSKRDAVFVRGAGAVVKAESAEDAQALKLLADKAALCALHTRALGAKVYVSRPDAALMRLVYLKKYSKKKG